MKDDELLKLYLLGSLDEEQADNLERRLLLESDLFELAEAVEGDLLMAAVRGGLSPADRGRILRRLAASPEGRARLALIRGLTLPVDEPTPAEVIAFRLLARPSVRAAAVAASLAIMAGGLWLATRTAPPIESNIAQSLRPVPEAPSQSPVPAVPPIDRIAERPPAPAAPTPPESHVRPEPAPLLLQLALTTMRSAGGGPAHLEIPSGARRVEIRLPLLPEEPSTSFAAILRNASTGEEIRRAERLAAQEVDGQKMVVLSVPVTDLEPGTYEVEVRGSTNEGDELLGRPTFEVVPN